MVEYDPISREDYAQNIQLFEIGANTFYNKFDYLNSLVFHGILLFYTTDHDHGLDTAFHAEIRPHCPPESSLPASYISHQAVA